MSNRWKDRKVHCIGKYNIYSIKGGRENEPRWYTEVHMYTRHGELYRDSFGSNMPTRLLAVWSSFLRYLALEKSNDQ